MREAGRDPAEVAYFCVDGTSGSMVLTNANLRPVSRALMYNSKGFDAEAKRIAEYAPNAHITQGSNSALARALRLLDKAPQADHLLHQADFVAAKLTGIGGQSDVMNALKTGIDPETADWPDWISELLPSAVLPKAHALRTPFGVLVHPDVIALGFAPSAQVLAGTTDSIAAFLAAAPLEPGVGVTSLGSTLAVKMLSARRIDDPAAGLYAHRVGNVWLVGGASNTGGRVLAEFFSPQRIRELSAQIDISAPTNLDYYPLLDLGERFPVNDPLLEPRLTPRPKDDVQFLHGLFEGIARIEAQCYAVIAAKGGGCPHRVLSAGGGTTNSAFFAIRAKELGLMPERPTQSEAAFGTAQIAFLSADKTYPPRQERMTK